MLLHPYSMKVLSKIKFVGIANDIENLCRKVLPSNFVAEAITKHKMWENDTNDNIDYLDFISLKKDFYLYVTEAIKISTTLPAPTCSIEC